jgi:hypothetical protein
MFRTVSLSITSIHVHTAIGICHTGYADCFLASSQHNMHLVGFIIRIYHDTRLHERQILHDRYVVVPLDKTFPPLL